MVYYICKLYYNKFDNKNAFILYVLVSRSGLSKYNILPSKDESSIKKSELDENSTKKMSDNLALSYNTGRENLRKIDITLTESSDRSESTSSELHTENLNSDYEENGNINIIFEHLY